jgi:hypothetical protein
MLRCSLLSTVERPNVAEFIAFSRQALPALAQALLDITAATEAFERRTGFKVTGEAREFE